MSSNDLAAETRQRIVDVAAEQFSRKGYSETTTRELSESVGLQKASLYHHYSSKELILYEICISALQDIQEAVSRARDEAQSRSMNPSNVLNAMIAAHMDSALGQRHQHATMLIELRHLVGKNREVVLEARARYEDIFHEQITVGQKQKALRADMSARILTLGLLNLLNWTIFWYSDEGPSSPADLGCKFARIFLEGVAPRETETTTQADGHEEGRAP